MTDAELVSYLAERAMGWTVYTTSGHRPGTRPLPHAWRWGDRLMVYAGGAGPDVNREWNPLAHPADADELAAKLAERGLPVPSDLTGREFGEAIAELLKDEDAPDLH